MTFLRKWPLTIILPVLFLLALLAFARAGEAADCYVHESGVYVCDARQRVPTFSNPGYAYGSFSFTRTYAWLEDYAPIYNRPGGDVVDPGTEGILYYTIEETVDAGGPWYRLSNNWWAPASSMRIAEGSRFAGVEVNEQPERPFGWLLQRVRPAAAPDTEPAEETERLPRYTFVQIYDMAEGEDGWTWFDIGGGRWIKQTFLALVDVNTRPQEVRPIDFWVEVDLYEQTFAAYEGNRMVYAGLISSGLDRWPTNEGLFQVYARNREWLMYGGEVGDDYYYLQDVPHTMFFDREIALHGAYWHDDFGQQRSHGCVNMPPRDAEWVWNWSENAPDDLWVWVHTSAEDHFLQKYGENLGARGSIFSGAH